MHSNAGDSSAVERSRRFGAVVEAAYCNIAKTVLLCTVPEVPVTVMVLVLGIVFEIPAEPWGSPKSGHLRSLENRPLMTNAEAVGMPGKRRRAASRLVIQRPATTVLHD